MEQQTYLAELSPDCRIMRNKKLLFWANSLCSNRKRMCVPLRAGERETLRMCLIPRTST